jgi:hypothetical protein
VISTEGFHARISGVAKNSSFAAETGKSRTRRSHAFTKAAQLRTGASLQVTRTAFFANCRGSFAAANFDNN